MPFHLDTDGFLWGLEPLLSSCIHSHLVCRITARHELAMLFTQEGDLQIVFLGGGQVADEVIPRLLAALIGSLVLGLCLGNGLADGIDRIQGTLIFRVDSEAVLLIEELLVNVLNQARALPTLSVLVSMWHSRLGKEEGLPECR